MNPLRATLNAAQIALRSQRIAYVFSRYALWEGLAAIGLEVGKRGIKWVKPSAVSLKGFDEVFGKKLAMAFVHLGPTFIKLGQMLALRPDWVGEPIAGELRVLFDQVPPIAFRKIKKILEDELGKKEVKKAFAQIHTKPLGCASIAQVHQAELKDGTPVILKVQKKGAARLVLTDLLILEKLALSANLFFPALGIEQMYRDFSLATKREIDYREEAKNIKKFQRNYSKLFGDADVIFPKHYPKLSTERVLTMEPLRGKKVSSLKKGSTVARNVASKSLVAVLEQIFDHGFFHADPHAGNLFFMEEEGRLGFIDLGLVGQLNPKDKRKFLKVLMAILQRDRANLAKSIFNLGIPSKKTNYYEFEKSIDKMLDDLVKQGIDKIKLDKVVNELLLIARRNQILIPNRYVLMLRAFLIIEGVAKSLDPKVSLIKVAPPIVARSLMRSYNPFRIFRR